MVNNKLVKVETVFIPCGGQPSHFKVRCDPDDEGNYMQCNVKKEQQKYVLEEAELIQLLYNAFRAGNKNYHFNTNDGGSTQQTEEQWVTQIINNETIFKPHI